MGMGPEQNRRRKKKDREDHRQDLDDPTGSARHPAEAEDGQDEGARPENHHPFGKRLMFESFQGLPSSRPCAICTISHSNLLVAKRMLLQTRSDPCVDSLWIHADCNLASCNVHQTLSFNDSALRAIAF